MEQLFERISVANSKSGISKATSRASNAKNTFKIIGVVLLVCGLALLPLAVFAVGDVAVFQAAMPMQQQYTPVQPTGDDFYLLRLLRSRTVARIGNSGRGDMVQQQGDKPKPPSFYLSAQTSRDGMTRNPSANEYAFATLQSMVTCGAVPQAWANAVTQQMQGDLLGFYTSADTLGLVTISYFLEVDDTYRPITLFSVTTDGKTGAVVSLFLTDTQPNEQPDTAEALNGFVQQAGLSSLADWVAPAGTSYEKSGLYSAQGQALATCATGEYARVQGTQSADIRYYYSLMLSTMEQDKIGVAPQQETTEEANHQTSQP